MAKGNLLVNGKNNITARANAMANIQSDLQNKNTASNVQTVTTPNLPNITRPGKPELTESPATSTD